MSQILLICLMEVRLSLTSWEAVTTASLRRRLLRKTIFFCRFVTIIDVYHIVNIYLVPKKGSPVVWKQWCAIKLFVLLNI